MDAKEWIKWGLIAVAAYFAATWLLNAANSAVQTIGGSFQQPQFPVPAPTIYSPWLYGSQFGPSIVEWGPPPPPWWARWPQGPVSPGDGRQPGTGGY